MDVAGTATNIADCARRKRFLVLIPCTEFMQNTCLSLASFSKRNASVSGVSKGWRNSPQS